MFGKFFNIFKGQGHMTFWVVALSTILAVIKTVIDPIIMTLLIDEALGKKDLTLFVLLITLTIGVSIVHRISGFAVNMMRQRLINKLTHTHTERMVSAYFSHPYKQVAEQGEGYFISRVYDDSVKLTDRGTRLLVSITENSLSFIAALVVCCYLSWHVTLVLLLIVPVLFLLSRKFAVKIYQQSTQEGENEALFRGGMVRCLDSFKLSNLFGLSVQATTSAMRVLDSFLDSNLRRNRTTEMYSTISSIFLSMAECLVMSIAAAAVFIGSITVGALMGYMSGFWKMMNSITRVIDRIPEFANLTAYINRTEDFAATARPNVHNDIAHVRLQAADIGFADPVIQQLDLDIQQGEHVLLLGQNGCGKTTLLHTLAGFIDVQHGAQETPSQDRISALLPPLNFFNGSLEDHLRLHERSADDQKRLHDMMIDFNLFDKRHMDPQSFSEGEKRKAMILLCLSKEADLYLFDEPLAAIDVDSKHTIMRWIEKITKSKTVLMVLHGDEEFHNRFDRKIKLAPRDLFVGHVA